MDKGTETFFKKWISSSPKTDDSIVVSPIYWPYKNFEVLYNLIAGFRRCSIHPLLRLFIKIRESFPVKNRFHFKSDDMLIADYFWFGDDAELEDTYKKYFLGSLCRRLDDSGEDMTSFNRMLLNATSISMITLCRIDLYLSKKI